ncbi:unnamed protein product [Adineta ricciae]|uniref:Uncharacterized protein n=1 Tax=Adineta ricciae TaxID=249248 RepID=A0A815LF91_ADIRI|nr:unnamed protein product [Adineta ricciae]CAF1517998.1 unnamed protein product [Adineta ricciae]
MPKKKKKTKKSAPKPIHYVQLRTHRRYPNASHYMSHLEVHNSKIQPLIYDIDRVLNQKWIHIRRSEKNIQLNDIHEQEIKKEFSHKIDLIDYRYFHINNQFDENNKFIRESSIHSTEIIDQLLHLYEQIEQSQRNLYEHRLNMIKHEFEQEKQILKHHFVDKELHELNSQINVFDAIEQDDILQQHVQFKLDKQQLQEQFIKDLTILYTNFHTQIFVLRSTVNKINRSNGQQINVISKNCRHLYEKTCRSQQSIEKETKTILILKRKIKESKQSIDQIDLDQKLNWIQQSSEASENEKSNQTINQMISHRKSHGILRRFVLLTDNVQKDLQKKLSKVERIFLLMKQCHRLELEEEKLLQTSPVNELNQVHHLWNCQVEMDNSFDELSLFYKRFAHVQMDLYIRVEENKSRKNFQNFYRKQLMNFY